MNSRAGYRGYISSRPVRGVRTPQRVQNLVVRDYAARRGLQYRLSSVEYAMPHCYMILEDVLSELPQLGGIIAFSIFMLPRRPARRFGIYRRILSAGAELHVALEELVLRNSQDITRFEEILLVEAWLPYAYRGGYWEKSIC